MAPCGKPGAMSEAVTLVERLCEIARLTPDAIAISFRATSITYADLARLVQGASARIGRTGAVAGDVVVVSGVSTSEALVCYIAAQAAGCIAAFSYHHATSGSLAAACKLANARLLVAGSLPPGFEAPCSVVAPDCLVSEPGPGLSGKAGAPGGSGDLRPARGNEEPPPGEGVPGTKEKPPEKEAPVEILFTTGTTGAPKAVVLSRRAVRAIALNTVEGVGIQPDDRVLVPLPINHSLALRVIRAVLWQGATVVLQSGFSAPEETERNICRRACTGMVTVPAALEMDRDRFGGRFAEVYGKLRYLEVGAGPLPVSARSRLIAELPETRIISTWGSSETGGVLFAPFSQIDPASEQFGASGLPVSGAQVVTVDSAGNQFSATAENPGRLALRGDMVMSMYLGQPELTASVFEGDWYVTNDLAYVDAAGFVHIVGRADDMINVGGEKVFPAEIEAAMSACPGVRECACVGVEDPDGVRGQVPVVFVIADGAFSEDACNELLQQRLEGYKMPREFVRIVELPRNRMMKLDRSALRDLWNARIGS